MSDEKPDMSYLIEGSSLGTEGARLLRRRAATADVASVVEAASAQQDPLDPLDALVEDAVHQEHHALDALLRRINPLVVRYCRARLGRQEGMFTLADDVAQEVGLAVLKALPHFREQGRPFMAFVFGIAAHKVADAHRAAARNRSDPVPDVPDEPVQLDGPEQRALQDELAGRMGRLLDTLPDKQREIVVLRVVVGLSAEETAEAVGSTPGAVRVAQHRALTRLRSTER